jgi:hypothetical protein
MARSNFRRVGEAALAERIGRQDEAGPAGVEGFHEELLGAESDRGLDERADLGGADRVARESLALELGGAVDAALHGGEVYARGFHLISIPAGLVLRHRCSRSTPEARPSSAWT